MASHQTGSVQLNEHPNARQRERRNQNSFKPDPSFEVAHSELREEELQIPDRSLQVTEKEVNLVVQSGEIYDANRNPEVLDSYIEPPPSHARKISFSISILIAIAYCVFLNSKAGEGEQDPRIKDALKNMFRYFALVIANIIINLIFYFVIKPHRIIKHAHHFLLLNLYKASTCRNVCFGYMICDFGIIFAPIAAGFLIVNTAVILMENYKAKKQLRAVNSKGNKLLTFSSNQVSYASEDIQMDDAITRQSGEARGKQTN